MKLASDDYRNCSAKERRGLGESPVPWLAPLFVMLLLVFIYPLFEVVRFSFTNARIGQLNYSYTIESFLVFFRDQGFSDMLRVTGVFVTFSVLCQLLLGFLIAFSVTEGEKLHLKGTVLIRTIVLMSMVIPGAIIGIIWRMMYSEAPGGLLNYLLTMVGAGPVRFLSDPAIAVISATVANVWRGTAQSMILLYAGLKTVPVEIMEAAKVDGANAWQRLTNVTIPTIMPVVLINLILNTIYTFNTFDMIMALTGGGPGRSTEVLALGAYSQIFQMLNLGRGSAIAVFLLAINTVMAAVYYYFMKKSEA
ncbi:carbohydrate ABC transporter membrane protein 1 (CUT1 family) [Hydrogenispora ethanolica]|jgi:multiple sugar transport system permease protein|uniref:Carbohydrate ABC transporter membrane protein 1 (CUT1 family) n=1 Tax=Hydrogenispora ethanolica TaxID=1082276 RepID=A0A4R1RIV9_HYDET|nr:sugar ABC transporter permease [Hydrogenispora ethanolica]TCL65929.1 carbohydrate ABC transporter membrane protein 1 (CUT1 family) [Hydrogenispora ethanolica]